MSLNEKVVALITLVGMNLGFSLVIGPMAVFPALASFPLAAAIVFR